MTTYTQTTSTKPTAMTMMNLTNKYNYCTKQINQNIPLNSIHNKLHTKQQYTVLPMITNKTTEWPVSMARIQLESTKPINPERDFSLDLKLVEMLNRNDLFFERSGNSE